MRSTYHHPYWVVSGEELDARPVPDQLGDQLATVEGVPGRWVDAGDLRVGDVLVSRSGGQSTVESLDTEHTPTTVYHIYVEDLHNYAVGDGEWLVHNGHRKMQAEELVEDGGFQVRRIGGLERPRLNAGTKATIAAAQKKNAAGQFIHPRTGEVIEQPQYGHREGFENWRIVKQGERLGANQDQLDRFVNAHPHYFEIQGKKFNESHIGELLGPDPNADRKILQDMEKFFGL